MKKTAKSAATAKARGKAAKKSKPSKPPKPSKLSSAEAGEGSFTGSSSPIDLTRVGADVKTVAIFIDLNGDTRASQLQALQEFTADLEADSFYVVMYKAPRPPGGGG